MTKSKPYVNWGMKLAPWVLIAPNMIIFLIFIIYPAIMGFSLSLTKWDGIGVKKFIALNNYVNLLKNEIFWETLGRTTLYTVVTVPLIMIVSLFLANLMIKEIRAKGFFRAVFYWPTMISFIIVGLSFRFLFGDTFGVINYMLELMGKEPVSWLTNSSTAVFVVISASVWSRVGFYMVTFISGLQSIPTSYYEACDVDGAKAHERFFYITLPLLKPTTFLVLILSVIDMFKSYPLVNALTKGGPNSATKFIVQYIYEEAFTKYNMGYASALSMVLFFILAIFTAIQFYVNKGGEVK